MFPMSVTSMGPRNCLCLLVFVLLSCNATIRIPLRKIRSIQSQHNDTTGSSARIGLKNLRNEEYWGTVSVGNPPQEFQVMFDTGSHLFWIPSSRCEHCQKKHLFNEGASSSFVDTNNPISISYTIGEMSGVTGRDTVRIGDVSIEGQELGLSLYPGFEENLFDGILGLSFASRTSFVSTVLENLTKQKLLESPIFSFYMSRTGVADEGGEVVMGGWNDNYFDPASLNYIPLVPSQFWKFNVSRITFGGADIDCGPEHACSAIADTGTTMIEGPRNQVELMIKRIGGHLQGGFYFAPCDRIPSMPHLSFSINGHDYLLKSTQYMFKNSSYPGLCMVGLSAHYDTEWTLGIVFLSNYYSVFDIENRRVAFAPLKV